MKFFINISGTHGYPQGVIPNMIKNVNATHFHLNYFYDANILINLADRPIIGTKSHKEEGKSKTT